MDLASIPTPRPADVVDAVTQPMLARSRALRRWCSLGMWAPGLIVGAMQFTEPHQRGDATALQLFILLAIVGLLPAAAVYLYFSSGMKRAPKLVRSGVASSAQIIKYLDGGGAKYVTVAWNDGREHRAKLKATNVTAPISEGASVTVLVSPEVDGQVGVVLGDNGLYIADGGYVQSPHEVYRRDRSR